MEVRLKKPNELTPTNLIPGQAFVDGDGRFCMKIGSNTVVDFQSNAVFSASGYTAITRVVNGAFIEE